MRPCKYPREVIDRAVDMVRNGGSIYGSAKQTGITKWAVESACKRAGVHSVHKFDGEDGRRTMRMNRGEDAQGIRDLWNDGKTDKQYFNDLKKKLLAALPGIVDEVKREQKLKFNEEFDYARRIAGK